MTSVERYKGSIDYARTHRSETVFFGALAITAAFTALGGAVKGVSEGLEALGIIGNDHNAIIEKLPEDNPDELTVPLTEGRTAYIS